MTIFGRTATKRL